jgi:hypothetical protein
MTAPLVHIGYHKTATNWFQRVFYPSVKNYRYVKRKTVRKAFLFPDAFCFDPEEARRGLFGISKQPPILCEEELSGNIHTGGHGGCFSKDVAERLLKTLPNARIVIFIRNQVDMIASVYLQYIKEGGTHRPKRYLFPRQHLSPSGFSPYHTPLFSFDHFRYRPLIEHYQDLFGPSRVHVFAYETFKADNRGFVKQLAERFDLEVDFSLVDYSLSNKSYTARTLALARMINRFTYRDVPDKNRFFHVPLLYKNSRKILKHFNQVPFMGRPPTPERLLGTRLVDYIRCYYYADNLKMGRSLGLPLEDLGYLEPARGARIRGIGLRHCNPGGKDI